MLCTALELILLQPLCFWTFEELHGKQTPVIQCYSFPQSLMAVQYNTIIKTKMKQEEKKTAEASAPSCQAGLCPVKKLSLAEAHFC